MTDISSLPVHVQAAIEQHHRGPDAASPRHGLCAHAEQLGDCGFAIPATRRTLEMLGLERFKQIAKHGDQSHLPDGTGWSGDVVGELINFHDASPRARGERPNNGDLEWAAIARTKAASQNEGGDGTITFEHILTEEYHEVLATNPQYLEQLQGELIQAGAVIVQWLESVNVRLDAERKALAERYAALDNDPIPESEVWDASTSDSDGLKVVWLGEDAEHAILPGHGLDYDDVARALDMIGDLDPDELEETYAIARPHMEGCLDDVDPDETCGCVEGDYAWWLHTSAHAKGAKGYFAVTEWRA